MLTKIKCDSLPLTKVFIVDVEGLTTDIRFNPNLPLYCICVLQIHPGGHNRIHRFRTVENAISLIQRLLDNGWVLIAHNSRFDYSVLRVRGLKHSIERGKLSVICTQVMAYFRDSNLPSFSLDALSGGAKTDVVQVCVDAGLIEAQDKKTFWTTDWSDHPAVLKIIEDYCVDDLKATHKVYKRLAAWYNQPDNQKFIVPLVYLEFPMLEVLSDLEINGLHIDQQRLSNLSHKISLELEEASNTLAREVGLLPKLQWSGDDYKPFEKTYKKGQYKNAKTNVAYYMDSSGVVCASEPYVIYDHCPLVPYNPSAATGHNYWLLKRSCPEVLEKTEKTKAGKPQLNKEYFSDISDSLPDSLPIAKILKLTKYLSMCQTLAEHIQIDGRLHCSFNNCRTRTGRLATNNPNLQNIPAREDIGNEFRKLFTASTPENTILVADLDRIEIVVLAWFLSTVMGDKGLLEICNTEGADVHQANADRWGVDRRVAKTLIFLLVYGGGASLIFKRGMADSLEIAEDMVRQVDEGQPAINQLKTKVWEKASKRGYITNPWLAHVPYPELNSKQKWERARGERQSFNCLIQRTARDIIHWLAIESLPIIRKHGGKIVNLIHDEAIVECPIATAEALKEELNSRWLNRYDILPGIKVNGLWNTGESWFTAK